MKIVFDGDLSAPEIQMCMTHAGLNDLGKRLVSFHDKVVILGDGTVDEFYPEALKGITCELVDDADFESTVSLSIEEGMFFCRSGRVGLGKLGQSLLNYFAESVGEGDHLHIDYYEGNQLIAPTQCSLIIQCVV